jgi:hypothetical protein
MSLRRFAENCSSDNFSLSLLLIYSRHQRILGKRDL